MRGVQKFFRHLEQIAQGLGGCVVVSRVVGVTFGVCQIVQQGFPAWIRGGAATQQDCLIQ
jgi:hypothetical protein